jgi:hypothetical protein
MKKKYRISIQQVTKAGAVRQVMNLDCEIVHNDFDEHDTAANLFALEFAANNFQEHPVRVHISEVS